MADTRRLCEESPNPGARDPSLSEETPPESGGEDTPLRGKRDTSPVVDRRRKLPLRKQKSVPYSGMDDPPRKKMHSMDKTHSLEMTQGGKDKDIERAQALEDLTEHDDERDDEFISEEEGEEEQPSNGVRISSPSENSAPSKKDKFKAFYLRPRLKKRSSSSEASPKAASKKGPFSSKFCAKLKWRRKEEKETKEDDDDLYIEDDPFRKKFSRACLNFVYILLAVFAAIFTYSLIQDLVKSLHNPVRSIHFHRVKDEYEAPGIAVYPGGAEFLACGHYYNNVVTSKVRLSQLDLVNHNCTFSRLNYGDPHYPNITRDVLVVRGPTSFARREAIFLHFALDDDTRDFFTVSYFVFRGWDTFNASEDRIKQIQEYHKYMPTFALSAGLRMWIKLIMSESFLMDGNNHTDFKVEYSVVKYWDKREQRERKKHLFFIFFEWKNDIIERSYLLYTTTGWSIGAGLCGVLLTLQRGVQFAQTSYKRVQKDKERRSIRKRTIRELRQQRSVQQQSSTDTAL